jgi:hypothetical protein
MPNAQDLCRFLQRNQHTLWQTVKVYAAAESACPRSLLWLHKRCSAVLSVFFLLFLRTKAARSAVPELLKPAAKGIPSMLEGIPFELKRVPFGVKGVPSGLKGIPFEAPLCRVSSGNSTERQNRTPYTPRVCSAQV